MKDLSLNNEKVRKNAEHLKQNLRSKFRDIWESVNEKYDQQYPCTSKLEEEFYHYYQNRKNHFNIKPDISIKEL